MFLRSWLRRHLRFVEHLGVNDKPYVLCGLPKSSNLPLEVQERSVRPLRWRCQRCERIRTWWMTDYFKDKTE